jgi:hypothetical protein
MFRVAHSIVRTSDPNIREMDDVRDHEYRVTNEYQHSFSVRTSRTRPQYISMMSYRCVWGDLYGVGVCIELLQERNVVAMDEEAGNAAASGT